MIIPVEKWYSAIQVRCSRRQFLEQPLGKGMLEHLNGFASEVNDFIKGVRLVIVNHEPHLVFKGAIGSYGKIKGARAYAAFIGDGASPGFQEKTGYAGECLILEATALGLATCWVGGFFEPRAVAEQIKIAPGEVVVAVTPLGYASEAYSLEEKLMKGFAKSHKRKPLEELCRGLPREKWPLWAGPALEAARLAPSAVNRQPWRFTVEEQAIKVSVDNDRDNHNIAKRLDCGIATLHLEVGAAHAGARGHWECLASPDVARLVIDKSKGVVV